MELPELRGQEVAVGLLLGSAVLFGIELAPVLARGIDLREPSRRQLTKQSYIDQLVTSWIVMAGLGVTIHMTAEMLRALEKGEWPSFD